MNSAATETNYITYLPQKDYEYILSEHSAVLYADLADIPVTSLTNLKKFASALFACIKQKGISPLASLMLQQSFNFDTEKGEDFISGTISSLCALAGMPVLLLLGNAQTVQEQPAFNQFVALLNDKHEKNSTGSDCLPSFQAVVITAS